MHLARDCALGDCRVVVERIAVGGVAERHREEGVVPRQEHVGGCSQVINRGGVEKS